MSTEGLAKIESITAEGAVSLIGRIMRVHEQQNLFIYTIADETGTINVASYYSHPLGDFIKVNGTVRKHGTSIEVYATEIDQVIGKERDDLLLRLNEHLAKETKPLQAAYLVDDEVVVRLTPSFDECASHLRAAAFTYRPVLIRYNGDADGICGALCVKRALEHLIGGESRRRLMFAQNNPAIYSAGDALRDVSVLRMLPDQMEKPVIVLIDFAANSESVEAVELLRGAGVEIIIIDHHPFDAKVKSLADCFVTPMLHEGHSGYCSGFLAGEVAKRTAEVDVKELQLTAMAGDKSRLHPLAEEHQRQAAALDFMAVYYAKPHALDFYDQAFNDKKFMQSVYEQAMHKLQKAVELAKNEAKVIDLPNGVKICKIALAHISKKDEFPSGGKIAGAIHDELSARLNAPLVTLGYGDKYISIRANQLAREKGFNASKMIEQLKGEMSNALESGGGHDVAASMRVNKGFVKIVLEYVENWIGKI